MSNEEKERLKERLLGMEAEQIEEIVKYIPSNVMFRELSRRDSERQQIIESILETLKNQIERKAGEDDAGHNHNSGLLGHGREWA